MPAALVDEVAAIIGDVDARGDDALLEHARRFDGDAFELSDLRVPIPMLESARLLVPPEIAVALELEKERLSRFHRRQRQPDIEYVEEDGTRYALVRRPLRSVAVYASRSGAPTSILMGAVPAKVAGVSRIVVLSPPGPTGFSAAVLFACALCGVDELYAIGGATAVAAAALGTRSLPSVDKIVGRGGMWTTEAKRQVFGRCGVDALAGPPEVLVVADEGANSEYVVGELLSVGRASRTLRVWPCSPNRGRCWTRSLSSSIRSTCERWSAASSSAVRSRRTAVSSRLHRATSSSISSIASRPPICACRCAMLGGTSSGSSRPAPSSSATRRRWSAGNIWPGPTASRRHRVPRVSRRASVWPTSPVRSAWSKIAPIG